MSMSRFIHSTAPWSAALLAFLGGAATAAGVIPVVFYNASEDFTALAVIVCGVLVTPFGALLGFGLRNLLH
jgi:hypothetical protein